MTRRTDYAAIASEYDRRYTDYDWGDAEASLAGFVREWWWLGRLLRPGIPAAGYIWVTPTPCHRLEASHTQESQVGQEKSAKINAIFQILSRNRRIDLEG